MESLPNMAAGWVSMELGARGPLADASPVANPLVIGIDHLFKVGIGQKAGRNVSAKSTDLGTAKLAQ